MKRLGIMLLVLTIVLGNISFVSFGEEQKGDLIYRLDPNRSHEYSLSEKEGDVVTVDGMIVARTESAVSYTIELVDPVPVTDLDMVIKFSVMVETENPVSYVAARIYGSADSNFYQSKNVVAEPKSNQWYETEFALSSAQNREYTIPIMEGGFITKIRLDVPNPSESLIRFYVKNIEFYNAKPFLEKSQGEEEVKRVNEAVAKAKKGSVITIKDGTYTNAKFNFTAEGTMEDPIIIKSETPGGVVINGESRIVIGGQYVTVDGLLLRDGTSSRVITFAPKSKGCRLTNSVMINWNRQDRNDIVKWIQVYGTYNRVDHCFFRGKDGQGQLLEVVRSLDEEQHNSIDNNYFGYHKLGIKNGCETLRFCNTTNTTTNCFSVAQNNFFDTCQGENETISNKSNDNKYINNTFYNGKGSLCLRIGKRCTVEGNLFIGGGDDTTTINGVTISDEDHVVKNNYFYNIAPSSVGIGLTNGTDPNAAAYEHVKNVTVKNNTLINCGTGIAVGKYSYMLEAAFPRIYPPKGQVLDNFLYTGYPTYKGLSLEDKTTKGVKYANNIVTGPSDLTNKSGVEKKDVSLKKMDNGLFFPEEPIGADYEIIKKAYLSPMEFLPDWIKAKVLSGDPNFMISQINIDITPKDEIFLMQVDNNKAYSFLKGTTQIDENEKITPIIKDETTLVPLRYVSENFGFDVVWFGEEQKIKLKRHNGYEYVEFVIGSNKMVKNGEEVTIDSEAMLLNDTSYIPLRAVAEAISKDVYWDDRGYIIITPDENLKIDNGYFDKVINYLTEVKL